MRKTTAALIISLLVLQFGCKDASVDTATGSQTGNLTLYFGKAPPMIVQIVAKMSRAGFAERALVLTIADSSENALGSFKDVEVGTWNLKVDALDDSGKVRYSGEAAVDVIGGQLTEVSLELSPTTGDVEIVVTWGGSCVPVLRSIVSWWSGDGNADDRVGMNDGILTGTVTYAQGKVGRAFVFNGRNSYVRIASSPGLNPTGSFTIEGWIYPEKDTFSMLFGKWGWYAAWENQRSYGVDLLPGGDVIFGIANDSLQWDLDFQDFRTTGGPIRLNAWNHLAVEYDQSNGARRIFVNGVLIKERIDPPITITAGIADLCIGAYHFAPGWTESFFKGKVDELGFYNRALSGLEICAIYGAGSSGKCR